MDDLASLAVMALLFTLILQGRQECRRFMLQKKKGGTHTHTHTNTHTHTEIHTYGGEGGVR